MLTEQQAWEHLLQGFSNPVPLPGSSNPVAASCKTGNEHSCCLCDAITDMWVEDWISETTEGFMLKKVSRYGVEYRTTPPAAALYWPADEQGVAARVEFIKLMLKEYDASPEPNHRCPAQVGNVS